MKVTNDVVRNFERQQKRSGTKTALQNVIWEIAADLMKDIGVNHIKTSERVPRRDEAA